jgi:hypothetical protein
MGSRYLTDLAAVCRAAGLAVDEEAGWQTRARRSGGYDPGRPTHVMVHHTASNPGSDPAGDVAYICHGSDNAPISNLYLSRTGLVVVCAAGATNTNGSGEDTWGGGVPDDAMNSYAIGIEAANNGVGEPWPQAQTKAYVRLCAALGDHYGIPVGHVRGHVEWAPGRKIDPAGPSPWATGAATWNMDAYRSSVFNTNPPDPDDGEDDMPLSDEDVQRIAAAVWHMKINTLEDGLDPYEAQFLLDRSFNIVRRHLGTAGEIPDEPALVRVDKNTRPPA